MSETPAEGSGRITTEQLSLARLQDAALWRGLQAELHLSDRELEVAIRLVLGDSIRSIARRLSIRPGTVTGYIVRIKQKAGVRYRGEVVTKLLLSSGLLLGE